MMNEMCDKKSIPTIQKGFYPYNFHIKLSTRTDDIKMT